MYSLPCFTPNWRTPVASPDPEGMTLLGKVVAAGMAVAAPIGWLWTKLDKKADKHQVNNQFQELKSEQQHQRETQAKLFDKLEEHFKFDSQNMQTIMTRMSDNHAEVLKALGTKADR